MKTKILIICRYEKWCVNWFNSLLRFLAYNVYANDKSLIVVNRRHRCVCIPGKEIIFVRDSAANEKIKTINPDKVINWDGEDIKELWDLI